MVGDGSREMPIGFSVLKAAQVIAFLVLEQGGKADMIKTVKLAYMSDRKFLDDFNRPILNDDLYCLDHGPIDSFTLNLIKGKASKEDIDVWKQFLNPVDKATWKFTTFSKNMYLGELSDAEEDVMRRIVRRFKDLGPFELVDWIHSHCREWSNPRGTSTLLSYGDVLKALGKINIENKLRKIDRARRLREDLIKGSFEENAA